MAGWAGGAFSNTQSRLEHALHLPQRVVRVQDSCQLAWELTGGGKFDKFREGYHAIAVAVVATDHIHERGVSRQGRCRGDRDDLRGVFDVAVRAGGLLGAGEDRVQLRAFPIAIVLLRFVVVTPFVLLSWPRLDPVRQRALCRLAVVVTLFSLLSS